MERTFVWLCAAALAASFSLPAQLQGQNTGTPAVTPENHDQHHPEATAQTAPNPAPTQQPAAPGGMSKEMMARMMAVDQKLDDLVKKMNAAKGADKTDAIAALLTALVEEHRSMRHMMMGDMSGMMMHGRGMSAPTPAK